MRIRHALSFLVLVLYVPTARSADDAISELIDQGHYKRAEALLRTQLQQNPNDPLANCLMSKVDAAFNRYDDAIAHAEKAVAADNNSGKYHAQLEDALGAKSGDPSAGMFKKMSVARRMKQEADIALRLDPKNLDANEDLLEFYLDAPGIVGGGKDKAKELADHVTQTDPAVGAYLQAHLAQRERHLEDAERFFKQAIQANRNFYLARIELANLYLNQSQPQLSQAEEQARLALKIDSKRAGPYTVLAVIAVKQSRWKDLDQILADSEQSVPDDFGAHYQAGKFIFLSGDGQQLSRSESFFRKYLNQPPEVGEPPLAAAHWRLALVLEKQGHRDDARAELQNAVKLDPNLKEAQQDLKHLK